MSQQEDAANTSQMDSAPQPMARPQRKWLGDIERLKGLAIILVVWGHTYDAAFPVWAIGLRKAIYAFHMPLFMFLSGYVFVYVGAHKLKGSLSTYTSKRAKRLLIPFFIMAAI
ncbi:MULTISPECIES: acyltransferase family protein [unclassified Rhizobium]|jgi:fucose 4-O-acetylase-like acetyltransferase|uniref:acyltransferase family protein n=1 Tax=unclassified Rhizobium TaxID=2613769 RepID=UPI0013AF2A22|nr:MULTISPECIES: acyltransferase family protein [unclassified Rhizobium]MBB3445727.1 fucose 4-O-acetylase-like acetyltransferase [Rhizobium sp. BK379]MBB3561708.1 fucose 4-O-acetylase-like acetyltransferase [Rhizobium sp. BK512]